MKYGKLSLAESYMNGFMSHYVIGVPRNLLLNLGLMSQKDLLLRYFKKVNRLKYKCWTKSIT